MTIEGAIKLLDSLKPNQYSDLLKVRWLSKLDGRVFREIIATHHCPAIDQFDGYDENTPMSTELLVPYPYDEEVYAHFLQASVDRENGEAQKYNQTITLYNNAFKAYQDAYNRDHAPIGLGRFRF